MTEITKRQLDDALGFALSDEQWAVVSAPLAPAVVVAGAGSGKTTAMAARVAWLIGSGYVAPQAALGLTFTTKAAASLLATMRGSLRRLSDAGLVEVPVPASDEVTGEPEVLTYNAFSARVLREHAIRIGREPGATVLTDGARQQLAYRVACRTSVPLAELGKGPGDVTSRLLALDDQLSELDIEPSVLMEDEAAFIAELDAIGALQRIGHTLRSTARERQLLAQVILEWREAKAQLDVIDFTDQTRLALQIVRRSPEVCEGLRARHGVVLLDEYQDTSIAQRALLQAVFGDGHAVTAVGDPCQAIYGWRGASVDNIERFVDHFPTHESGARRRSDRYVLKSNRRSGPAILTVANTLAADLRARHAGVEPLESAANGKGAGVVRVGLFETAADERAWIAQTIADAGRRTGAWGDIAVLASTGRDLAALDALLRANGVPTQLYGAAGLLRQPAVVELRSMLEVLHDPIANPAMLRLLTGPRWAIGVRDLAGLGTRAAELAGGSGRLEADDVHTALDQAVAGADPVETVSLSDAVLDLGSPDRFSPEAYERLQALAAEIRMLRAHVGESIVDLIGRIARTTGLDVEVAISADREQQQQALATFVDLAAQFTDLEGGSTLGAFLSRLRDAERFDADLKVDLIRRPDAVQLLTVHKAKGLEFGHVFVMSMAHKAFPGGMARGEWPSSATAVPWRLRDDTNEVLDSFPDANEGPRAKHYDAYREALRDLQDADTDRLAYVALTRAERTLTVTGHWWGETQSTRRGPDPYLTAIRAAAEEVGGEIVHWHDEPDPDATNPSPQAGATDLPWPTDIARADALAMQAALVQEHLRAPEPLPGLVAASTRLTDDEAALVDRWATDAELLLAEARARHAPIVAVPLPDVISASTAIRAIREPEVLAVDLARPMPAAPAPAARRGTAFHAWVETRYGQQSLLDLDDLPGAGDDSIISDEQLIALREAFERSVYAGRIPVAVEVPFTLALGGRVLRGRIDAVFADGDRFEVVDWKTGSSASTDLLQLAIYRLAWANLRGVPAEQVDAAFVLVATGEVIRPDDLPDASQLAAALAQ